jgi:hypothetical protein
MKRSAAEWWTEKAEAEKTTLPKLIPRLIEEKADHKPVGRPEFQSIPKLREGRSEAAAGDGRACHIRRTDRGPRLLMRGRGAAA